MYQTTKCLCCDSDDLKIYPSIISDFISDYVLNKTSEICFLYECNNCSMRFFNQRFNDDEIIRLYQNYRNDDYFLARNNTEFWYTKTFNDSIGNDESEIESRKKRMENFLKSNLDTGIIHSILDYGGDRGQFIPDCFKCDKYVYEVSDSLVLPGIKKITEQIDLKKYDFDLIILSNIFEHLSSPDEFIKMLLSSISDKKQNQYFYIEIPLERWNLLFIKNKKSYISYLNYLTKHKNLRIILDFITTISRAKLNIIPPGGFIKLSEHINFYSEESLIKLLNRNSLDVISIQQFKNSILPTLSGVISIIAKKIES